MCNRKELYILAPKLGNPKQYPYMTWKCMYGDTLDVIMRYIKRKLSEIHSPIDGIEVKINPEVYDVILHYIYINSSSKMKGFHFLK